MATQIQHGHTNTNWLHKYNMATQVQRALGVYGACTERARSVHVACTECALYQTYKMGFLGTVKNEDVIKLFKLFRDQGLLLDHSAMVPRRACLHVWCQGLSSSLS